MSKYCLICEVSKYEIDQHKRVRGIQLECITINGKHVYKKRVRMPKIHKDQLEFIET